MGANKYEFQPIREALSLGSGVCIASAWVFYWLGYRHDLCMGMFETGLILIIASEAYARD